MESVWGQLESSDLKGEELDQTVSWREHTWGNWGRSWVGWSRIWASHISRREEQRSGLTCLDKSSWTPHIGQAEDHKGDVAFHNLLVEIKVPLSFAHYAVRLLLWVASLIFLLKWSLLDIILPQNSVPEMCPGLDTQRSYRSFKEDVQKHGIGPQEQASWRKLEGSWDVQLREKKILGKMWEPCAGR